MVVADNVLNSIAEDLVRITTQIETAQDLISAMKEAGESVSDLEGQLFQLRVRKTKWETMLRGRGYTV